MKQSMYRASSTKKPEGDVPVNHSGDRCSGCSEWLWCNGEPLPPHTQLQCLVVLNSRLTAGLESFERKLANKASELDFKVSRVQRRLPWWCKLGLALAFLFAASVASAQPTGPNSPQCTNPGWYQRSCDFNWNFAIPGNLTGHTFQGCSAHTLYIYDEDGATYAILDQCPVGCTGTMGTYPKPDHPGAALTLWNHYYTDPNAQAYRQTFGYNNPSFQIPTGVQHYTFIPLSQVQPPSQRAALAAAYGCVLTTPTPFGPTPTPVPNQFGRYITWATDKGIMSGCGNGMFCPGTPVNGLLTRAQFCAVQFNTYRLDHPNEPLPACRPIYQDVVCP